MSYDFESQLEQRLAASARSMPYKADRSKIVVKRGRRRRIASQVGTSAAAVVVLMGVFSVANRISEQPEQTTQVLAEPDGRGTGGGGIVDVDGESGAGEIDKDSVVVSEDGGGSGDAAGNDESTDSANDVDDAVTATDETGGGAVENDSTAEGGDSSGGETNDSGATTDDSVVGEEGAKGGSGNTESGAATEGSDQEETTQQDDEESPEQSETSPPVVLPPRGKCLAAPALAAVAVTDPGKKVVKVKTEKELQRALDEIKANTVILLSPGTYALTKTVNVNADNVTLRGDSNRCDEVLLTGRGMDNKAGGNVVGSGIWTDKSNMKVQNLSISGVYRNSIQIASQGNAPELYNLRLENSGESFIIGNAATHGAGPDAGSVNYVTMSYPNGPPKTDHGGGVGLTNGVIVLGGNRWVIKNSRFENFHTPDSADHLWNGAVVLASGSSNARVESNTFINTDRAIVAGVEDESPYSNSGGTIRNNMIVMDKGLYSSSRRAGADAPIIVWDSPNTTVIHNTIITQGNTPLSIELRFSSDGSTIKNNLVDAAVGDRSSNRFENADNIEVNDMSLFRNLANGDLHLTSAVDTVDRLSAASTDFDGQRRRSSTSAGADEYSG